jgi:hypothetical protein
MTNFLGNKDVYEAYLWCIKNKIYIAPFCKEVKKFWYIDITINGRTNRSPVAYDKEELAKKMGEYYKYYYDKYKK